MGLGVSVPLLTTAPYDEECDDYEYDDERSYSAHHSCDRQNSDQSSTRMQTGYGTDRRRWPRYCGPTRYCHQDLSQSAFSMRSTYWVSSEALQDLLRYPASVRTSNGTDPRVRLTSERFGYAVGVRSIRQRLHQKSAWIRLAGEGHEP